MPPILVIDDDERARRLVAEVFRDSGFEIAGAADAASGLDAVAASRPDVVLLDRQLPDGDGLDVLARLRAVDPGLPVVMLTASNDVKIAVRATQLGAFDYLTKPFDPDELELVVRRALETRALRSEVAELRRRLSSESGLAASMGPSPEIARVDEQVRVVAGSIFSVLVLGETGTGKELVAQAIHRQSERRKAPFIAIDCGAIPEPLLESELFGHEKGAFTGADRRRAGHFHLAQGGTLFLDEVGNLPLGLQAKLLRVLESRMVHAVGAPQPTPLDVRFIAATNDDLRARCDDGRFRADLYFRLAQYTISLPPLRARPSDIEHLARRFMDEAAVELRRPVFTLAPDAVAALEAHRWPGNVRELRNVVRQAVLESAGPTIDAAAFARQLARPAVTAVIPPEVGLRPLREIAEAAAREAERKAIEDTLRHTRGNKSEAARLLRTDYKTLHVKIKALGIRARDYADA